MKLPSTFISNIHAVYGEAGKVWLKKLPSHLEFLSARWNFRFIQPLPNLTYSFVALVELNENHEIVILKTAPSDSPIITEAHCLTCFKKSVPRVFQIDEVNNAFLMEHLTPGEPLKCLIKKGQDEIATKIICQTILQLQNNQQTPKKIYKHITELAVSLPILKGQVEDNLLAKAESLFHDLCQDRSQDVLLHGDLHHDNILSNGSSWKVIDPQGYIGDPAAEVGAMIRNPFDCFPTDQPLKKIINTRLKMLADELPFDPQKINAWAFCLTMLSAAWDIEEHGKISANKIDIARVIGELIKR